MFSPNQFFSKLSQYGGVDKTNLFMIDIERYSSDEYSSSDLKFFCKTSSIPGIDFSTTEYKPQSYGMSISLPTGVSNPGLSCIFILDSANYVLSFFHNWAQKVLNYDTSQGMLTTVDGKLPYEIGYLRGSRGYGSTMTITKFNPYEGDILYSATIHDAYPINIGSIGLSWDDQNQYSSLPVSFAYSSISFTGSKSGTTSGNLNRSQGNIQYLSSLRRKGQTINSYVDENIIQ